MCRVYYDKLTTGNKIHFFEMSFGNSFDFVRKPSPAVTPSFIVLVNCSSRRQSEEATAEHWSFLFDKRSQNWNETRCRWHLMVGSTIINIYSTILKGKYEINMYKLYGHWLSVSGIIFFFTFANFFFFSPTLYKYSFIFMSSFLISLRQRSYAFLYWEVLKNYAQNLETKIPAQWTSPEKQVFK